MSEFLNHRLVTDWYNPDEHFDHFPYGFREGVTVSEHFVSKVRKRVAAKMLWSKMPYNVLDRGLRPHELRGYLKKIITELMYANPVENRRYILFQWMVFVIALEESLDGYAEVCFITCFHLKPQERQAFQKLWKKLRKNTNQ